MGVAASEGNSRQTKKKNIKLDTERWQNENGRHCFDIGRNVELKIHSLRCGGGAADGTVVGGRQLFDGWWLRLDEKKKHVGVENIAMIKFSPLLGTVGNDVCSLWISRSLFNWITWIFFFFGKQIGQNLFPTVEMLNKRNLKSNINGEIPKKKKM